VDVLTACCVQIRAGPGVKRPYKNKVLKNKSKPINEEKMTNETTENFLKVMATFHWPEPKPVSYRLYYNEDGTPKCYTMEDLPGKYVEIDRETYLAHLWNVRVIDNKLQIIPPAIAVNKLRPNEAVGTPCHTQDVCVIVSLDQSHTKWKLITNETY
jgi:hypothetical protein